MKHNKDSEKIKAIALERIKQLFAAAFESKDLAKRYVIMARKIAMKSNLRLPSNLKRKFCRNCNSFFNSKNSRIRTREGKLIYYCLECKKFTRIPIRSRPIALKMPQNI